MPNAIIDNLERVYPVATIEIFRDAATPEIAIEPVYDGLNIIQGITGGLQVLKDNRKIKVPSKDKLIQPEKIRWPVFSSDFAIIASGNPFYVDLDEVENIEKIQTGVACTAQDGTRVAIIDVARSSDAAGTTVHEVGHFLGLKHMYEGVNSDPDDKNHCVIDSCFMSGVKKLVVGPAFENDDSVLEPEPTFETITGSIVRSAFCGECTEELVKSADIINRARMGGMNPFKMYYPGR